MRQLRLSRKPDLGARADTSATFDPRLVTGVILAGGGSSRIGGATPKPLLSLGGKILLARVADVLKPICREMVLAVRPGQQDDTPDLGIALGMHVVEDDRSARGPIAGLRAGLAACTAPLAFVVGADHPFLSAALILEMLRQAHLGASPDGGRYAAVALRYAGYVNPLHAVYPVREWLAAVDAAITRGDTSPTAVLEAASAAEEPPLRVIAEDEIARLDPQHLSLFDVDTLEDLGKARRIVDRRGFRARPDLRRSAH